jgi:hypothetical protein
LATGVSAFLIVVVISCTVLVIYGVHFVGDKSEELVTTIGSALGGLDEFQESLPPIVADVLNDRREPAYREQIEIAVRMSEKEGSSGARRMNVEVTNNGEEVVSLLSFRIVVVDGRGEVVAESDEWAATPFATDGGWRGPLMSGSKRRFVAWGRNVCGVSASAELKIEVEITDLRVWNREGEKLAVVSE